MSNLFEQCREIIMSCAYKRGMWEQILVCHPMHREYRNDKIKFYTDLIDMCYMQIEDLKKKGMIV